MTERLRRTLITAAAVFGITALAVKLWPSFGPSDAVTPLERGSMVEKDLVPGDVHAYTIPLAAAEYLHVKIDQRGVDVVAELFDPRGDQLTEVDALEGSWGPENLHAIAERAGEYRLEVRPWSKSEPGRYRLAVQRLALPKAADRRRAEAARAFQQGEELRQASAFAEAAAAYTAAGELWNGLGDSLQESITVLRLGRLHSRRGEMTAALEHYERSLALVEGSEHRGQEAGVLVWIGPVYRRTGRPAKALAAYRRALAIYTSLGHRSGEALALNNMAVVHNNAGEIEKALERYEEALAIWREAGRQDEEALILFNLGTLYTLVGKDQEAIDLQERSLELYRALEDTDGQAMTLTALGWSRYLLNEPAGAVALYREALELRSGDVAILDRLGTALVSLGRMSEARLAYEEAEASQRRTGNRLGLAITLNNLGRLFVEQGRPDAALDYYREALPLLREVGDRHTEAAALAGQARAERARGDLQAARTLVEASLELSESLRRTTHRAALRSAYLASHYGPYELYIDLLMELHAREPGVGADALALQASERARAQGLLSMLFEARAEVGRRIDPGLAERRRLLVEEIHRKEDQRLALPVDTPEARRSEVERDLRSLLLEFEKLRAEVRLESPAYAALTDPRPLSLDETRRILDGDSALVFFAFGEERSFVWWLTEDTLASRTLPPRPEIETAARRLHQLLAASHQREARAQARRQAALLGEMILGPVADLLGSRRRLLVVSDGALHYLPLAALSPGGDQGEPLIENHEIVRLPSISVMAELRRESRQRPPATGLVAVVADAVFDPGDPRVRPAAGAVRRDPTPHPERHFPPLVHSRREAEAILGLAPPGTSFAALGFAANRETVMNGSLRRYRVVHFATHGVLDTRHPELSGIVLSLVDESGAPRDGFLRAHEIYSLELDADLVVLSACRTALGQELRGEGLVSLAHGLMYAGASSVVVSLWSVSDQATAELMERFYRALFQEGLSPAAALRAAQLDLRREPRWRSPYFWAGFVLLGEWRGSELFSQNL